MKNYDAQKKIEDVVKRECGEELRERGKREVSC